MLTSALALACCARPPARGDGEHAATAAPHARDERHAPPSAARIQEPTPVAPAAQSVAPPVADPAARGAFGLSRVTTADGKAAPIAGFGVLDDCSTCHARQAEEFEGSFHSRSHRDPFYRAFAELARAEAGPEIYAWCSGCHAPAGVVAGLIPGTRDEELPEAALAGVQCDVCHQVNELTGASGPWKEPGNASFVLAPGKVKSSIRAEIQVNPNHTVARREFLESAEFCASCHTVIHPLNGLRVEHTYGEWKESVYARKGIQCQDCHMRTVEQAIEVARTLERVKVTGTTSEMSAKEREIHPHYFVGGNSDAERLTGSAMHATMAEARLKSAATLAIHVAERAANAPTLRVEVAVTNIGAGHALPTSLTELREMWVELVVRDAAGDELHHSGALDAQGELRPGTLRFGSELLDAEGKPTFRLWKAQSIGWKRCIAPKATERETFEVAVPPGSSGPLAIEARLLYRSASPRLVRELMKDAAYEPRIVEMASASSSVVWR